MADIVTCAGCGRAKASHNFCPHCYSSLTRGFKTEAKQAQRVARPSSSSSSTCFDPDSKSLADAKWAKQRGGAIPLQEGQSLTKWMRARLGFRKGDPNVRLGSEDKVTPSKPRAARWNGKNTREHDDDKDDDDHHHHGGSSDMPSNLRFA